MQFNNSLSIIARGSLVFSFAVLATPAFAVNLVSNGSFSTIASGDITHADYSAVTDYLTGGVYGTGIPEWTIGNFSGNPGNQELDCMIDYAQNTSNSNLCGTTALGGGLQLWIMPGASPDGGNYFMMDAVPTYAANLWQTVTGLVAGTTYALSFYEATGQQKGFTGAMTQQWLVSLGSQTIDAPVMNTPNHSSDGWQQVTMDFTATSTSEVLSFAATGTPSGEPPMIMLDGVSLNQTPEPGTYALVGLGLFTLAMGLRRRHAKAAAAI